MKTCKHDYVPLEIKEVHQEAKTPSVSRPAPAQTQQVQAQVQQTQQTEQPQYGYVPKQGKLTVEDVEKEIEMLMERMEFLEKTLQDLKKENEKNL